MMNVDVGHQMGLDTESGFPTRVQQSYDAVRNGIA